MRRTPVSLVVLSLTYPEVEELAGSIGGKACQTPED
jgi:hypothetical protein